MNEWGRVLSNEDRTNITKDDAGDNRLLIGYQENGFSNGNVGVKLSQEGNDVLSATGDQLIWSTDFNSFKIVQTGVITTGDVDVPNPGAGLYDYSSREDSVAHNLGYVPAMIAYYTNGGLTFQLPRVINQVISTTQAQWVDVGSYVDETNLYIITSVMVLGTDHLRTGRDIRYFLLRETAS